MGAEEEEEEVAENCIKRLFRKMERDDKRGTARGLGGGDG